MKLDTFLNKEPTAGSSVGGAPFSVIGRGKQYLQLEYRISTTIMKIKTLGEWDSNGGQICYHLQAQLAQKFSN